MVNRLGALILGAGVALIAGAIHFAETDPVSEPVSLKAPNPSAQRVEPAPLQVQPSGDLSVGIQALEKASKKNLAWFSGYASTDPYPLVMALRQSRQSGSFASYSNLIFPCLEFDTLLLLKTEPLLGLEKNERYATRAQAKESIRMYCSQFPGAVLTDLLDTLADDEPAQKLTAAFEVLGAPMIRTGGQLRAAIEELAAQGQLYRASLLKESSAWQGKRWKGNEEVFVQAFDIARLRATSEPGMAGMDVRLKMACWKYGRCDNDYSAVPSRFTEDMKRETLALAAEMEQAFRKGDVSAFLGPP